jgi:hypothetical protein
MNPNETSRQEIDWESCTFEGAEREQLRVWSGLPLRQKLQAVEEMGELANKSLEWRKSRGLPYFDPGTGELVKGAGGERGKTED